GERGVELLVDATAEVLLGQPLVVEDRPELVDQVVMDLLTKLVEDWITPAVAARRACALNLVQALVERHLSLAFLPPRHHHRRRFFWSTRNRSANCSIAFATPDFGASSTTGV